MYELKQLRCFVAVAEELHFGKAAKHLHMTQLTLSRQVQMLEQGLKIKLLTRTSRTVQLTPAGRAFLPEARRILALTESAAIAARRIAKGESQCSFLIEKQQRPGRRWSRLRLLSAPDASGRESSRRRSCKSLLFQKGGRRTIRWLTSP